ncbi:response regulator [Luteimonas dalianensis]|uniref:response regulator n=1 Tax=Luteimonas dalianensis TaxID=1148196 RepID=UPI003BF05CB7
MKPRLLLLEDEPTSRMFLAAALTELPVEVDLAGTVAQGREMATNGSHALWLFDANLPDGTGSGLLAELRAGGHATRALAHTASAGEDERARLLADGFDTVVVKPLPATAWRDAVRAALETGHALPVGEPAAQCAAPDAPVWDDGAAAAALAGNLENVAALRQLFLAELPAARDRIVAAASYGDETGVRDALHRLRASCGFVGAARLDAAGRALGDAPGCAARLQAFVDAANATAGQPSG